MSGARLGLAQEPDFTLGGLKVSPSACRVSGPGGELRIEPQTMAVLMTLARARGATVTRDQLIEACWQGRVVSDDAVTRTIAKVRALAAATAPAFTLETLPKVGYRLLAEGGAAARAPDSSEPGRPIRWRVGAVPATVAAGVLLLAGLAYVTASSAGRRAASPEPPPAPQVRSTDVADALFNLDEARLQRYLQAGWGPDWRLDSEGNAALHQLMLVCERNPTHDQAGVLRVAKRLVAAGAHVTLANKWGDTPLIIARSKRYCGPNHPVVAFLRGLEPQRPG